MENKYGYAYFNPDGTLKEFIIDPSVRQGNQGINKLRIYWEGEEHFTSMAISWIDTDQENPQWIELLPLSFQEVDFRIPTIQNFDPRYFQYGKLYSGYEISLDDLLKYSGNFAISLYVYDNKGAQVAYLGIITLNISETGANYQSTITKSQYYLLLDLFYDTSFGNYYTKEESDDRYPLKSNVYTKSEVYNKSEVYSKNESDLRYYTKSEIIANYATKSYVDNEVQNVREVAEGKCKTYIISCDEGIAPTDETEFNEDTYYYPDGTQIKTWQDYQTFTNGLYCSNDDFNDQDNAINITASYIITNEKKVIPLNSTYLHKGDIVLVIQTNVPDRWYDGGNTMYSLETSKVDLSDYARLSLGNTFNGKNIFNGTSFFDNSVDFEQEVSFAGSIKSSIYPQTSNTYDLGLDNGTRYAWKNLYLNGSISMKYGSTNLGYILDLNNYGNLQFSPVGGNTTLRLQSDMVRIHNPVPIYTTDDLGSSSYTWRDLYLSRNLTDGTNSITIADIANGTFNVINATDIVNNTLTQAQYDLITNGKPTLIKGTFFNKLNPIILSGYIGSSSYFANMFGIEGSAVAYISSFIVNKTTLVCSVQNNSFTINMAGNVVGINGNVDIKGKRLPENPTNTGTFGFKQVNGTLSWQQEWYGTQAEYDALGTYDNNTIYNIIEE